MASLKEIAAHLGVSHALVSRVLNNRMGTTRVSAKMREAIMLRAREVDFQPNPLALALKQGRKGAVGIFIHGVGVEGSEMSLNFIKAAGKSLADLGLNLWLQFFESEEEFRVACNEKLMRKLDGLIVAGMPHPELLDNLRKIEARGLHVVAACHGYVNTDDIVNFQVDHEMQSYLAAKHLLEIGCRRIAHFHVMKLRFDGYLRAHREAVVDPDPRLCLMTCGVSAAAGIDGMENLLSLGVPFDGLCAQSDAQAAGAMQCLAARNISRK